MVQSSGALWGAGDSPKSQVWPSAFTWSALCRPRVFVIVSVHTGLWPRARILLAGPSVELQEGGRGGGPGSTSFVCYLNYPVEVLRHKPSSQINSTVNDTYVPFHKEHGAVCRCGEFPSPAVLCSRLNSGDDLENARV